MRYNEIQQNLKKSPKTWLITGAAGFIGSNLLEKLLRLNQNVVGLDNFSTGYRRNLDEVEALVTKSQWDNFKFIEGDICNIHDCQTAANGCDYILHQAALGSVPRSVENPVATNDTNITGFLNMLIAGRDARVKSFTYAASSSTYGDHPTLPKVEENIGNPLSPYAVTKYVNELYAQVFSTTYGFDSIGLRYFNVFGARQDPNGAYAAVIPKWISSVIKGDQLFINGDGETTRDFSYIDNVVQANILAATATNEVKNNVFNVAVGESITLNELYRFIQESLEFRGVNVSLSPQYRDFRKGDVRHSLADISKAKILLHYAPKYNVNNGLNKSILWYLSHFDENH